MIINQSSFSKSNTKTLVVLVGPTATGKTRLAIQLAVFYNTSIISADSRQFFKELNIGTAAPTPEEHALAKHHFAGNLSIHEHYNVSNFEQDAILLTETLFKTHDYIILTGGSGMYVDAVCNGIDDMPDYDPEIRLRVEALLREKGINFLREELARLDPEYYNQVDKANPNRLKRALEICLQTGKTFTSFRNQKKKPRNFRVVKVGINRPREELYESISRRTEAMIEQGLVEEVKSMLPHQSLNALNTVGYKEIFEYLAGEVSLTEAIENIKTNTRRYAKRQLTWFRRDKEIRWFLPEAFDEIVGYIEGEVRE
ncbi:MAG: tRNA (adenosine(37)-N6)-dimethylallyltransferase MiaA [Bacteroidales bacterium]|nr:tRNA (adenosine(37)-N6)-dimethylallyltransferase MiaA [Bacteroidales bacterium]